TRRAETGHCEGKSRCPPVAPPCPNPSEIGTRAACSSERRAAPSDEVGFNGTRVTTGRVVAGKVVVEGFPLEEGTILSVIAPNEAESFEPEPTKTKSYSAPSPRPSAATSSTVIKCSPRSAAAPD